MKKKNKDKLLMDDVHKIIKDYSRTWELLQQYDEGTLKIRKSNKKVTSELNYEDAKKALEVFKSELNL